MTPAAAAAGTVAEALGAAVDALTASGLPSPRLDAELLLEAATGWDRGRFVMHPDAGIPAHAAREFGAMVRRRLRCEPVAYILGRKGFRRIELAVDRRVLIPRPETELLVEVALEGDPGRVIDVGTGSGAVALAVADELPGATVVASDASEGALQVARANAERLGLADRASFQRGMLAEGSFDLLLANLPYVSDAEWEGLAPEIREYEPRDALVAGPTGLEAIEELLAALADRPRPAVIALEAGAGQAPAVARMLRGAGFGEVEARPDLAGIERVIVGRN